MLMALDQFVFSIGTLAHQELQRKTSWRHASNARVNARPAHQFVGPGDDTITISGVLYPELAGKLSSLDSLRAMGDRGEAYVLVDGTGGIFGAYLIQDVDETRSYFDRDGKPRKVDFSITLQRTDDRLATSMRQADADPTEADYAGTIA